MDAVICFIYRRWATFPITFIISGGKWWLCIDSRVRLRTNEPVHYLGWNCMTWVMFVLLPSFASYPIWITLLRLHNSGIRSIIIYWRWCCILRMLPVRVRCTLCVGGSHTIFKSNLFGSGNDRQGIENLIFCRIHTLNPMNQKMIAEAIFPLSISHFHHFWNELCLWILFTKYWLSYPTHFVCVCDVHACVRSSFSCVVLCSNDARAQHSSAGQRQPRVPHNC